MGDTMQDLMKRIFDVALASLSLVVLSPVVALVALLVRLRLGTPVLFRQVRPGLGGQPFTLMKFRTMRDGPGTDAERLTSLGAFLRRTSLDELPELLNVVRGDMSLVGPRPLLLEYLPLYSPHQARRHEVRPGITGWAQVNGWRGETDTLDKMIERVRYDLEYIRRQSFRFDLEILSRTIFGRKTRQNAF